MWPLFSTHFKTGCVTKVHINGKQVDLLTATERFKVTPGCDIINNDPCHNHLCQQGTCKPRHSKSGYHCKCKPGFSGTYCDQGRFVTDTFWCRKTYHYFFALSINVILDMLNFSKTTNFIFFSNLKNEVQLVVRLFSLSI